jgi:hemerythrin-like domain-containing protein
MECWAAKTCSRVGLLQPLNMLQYALVEITEGHQSSSLMSHYDATELLLVCESIIEHGELTYDELYRLADWLNNHPEACHHWPGNLLVEPYRGHGQTVR